MSKPQVFYIHGGSAFSEYEQFLYYLKTVEIKEPAVAKEKPTRWADHLRADLGSEYEVFAPTMPNTYNSQYQEWKIWFERHFEYLHDDISLIGWSQGGMFLVKYLLENEMPVQIKSLILIAAPFEAADFQGEDGGDFIFDTDRLRELSDKIEKIYILHSEDDFVVPYEHALKYQAALPEATLHTFTDKNHFLVPQFPELIDLIKNVS